MARTTSHQERGSHHVRRFWIRSTLSLGWRDGAQRLHPFHVFLAPLPRNSGDPDPCVRRQNFSDPIVIRRDGSHSRLPLGRVVSILLLPLFQCQAFDLLPTAQERAMARSGKRRVVGLPLVCPSPCCSKSLARSFATQRGALPPQLHSSQDIRGECLNSPK